MLSTGVDPIGRTRASGSTVVALIGRARRGEQRAVARLISIIEAGGAQPGSARQTISAALPAAGRSHVIGLTGPPGVGKSTMTSALVTAYRQSGCRVGVLAVDPSSPFSGGALLGDRVRLGTHAGDDGVFTRSMASRGRLGGLAAATSQAVGVLDAAGFDPVIVETVGVGQSELDVTRIVDTTVLMLAPGMGDEIQAAKAGIMEVADIFVVNKADHDGAASTVRDLRRMLALAGSPGEGRWTAPILTTVAARGERVGDVVSALGDHRLWSAGLGRREDRLLARAEAEITSAVVQQVSELLGSSAGADAVAALTAEVVAGRLDPYRAAAGLLAAITRRVEDGASATERVVATH